MYEKLMRCKKCNKITNHVFTREAKSCCSCGTVTKRFPGHWTNYPGSFQRCIVEDFVESIEVEMDRQGMTITDLARKLGWTNKYTKNIFNNSPNLKVDVMVKIARTLGMKLALFAYNDGDPDNNDGPILYEIFEKCWKKCGSPKNFYDLEEKK